MTTLRLPVDSSQYDATVETAAKLLRQGGIVAIPTETVYGLAASAFDEKAVEKIFTAKGRPQDNPLIVHIAAKESLSAVAREIPDKAFQLIDRFWPGPLTLVLKRNAAIPSSVSAGLDTVAVRMPENQTARDIIEKSALPLAAPSANTSGKPSPTTPEAVLEDLNGKIDAAVMAENCTVGVESTVVTLCTDPPRLLRPGAVTAEELREILPDLIIDPAVLAQPAKNATVSSPGMKYKHYAPQTETRLVEGSSDAFIRFVNEKAQSAAICFAEEAEKIIIPKLIYGTKADESSLAHEVFSVLRRADSLGVKTLYVHAPSKDGVGLAVYNRLIRAAAFQVVKL